MKSELYRGRGESLSEENITSGMGGQEMVISKRAQKGDGTGPEGSTSAMTGANTMVDGIVALLGLLDQRKLNLVYRFIKAIIG